MTTSNSIKNLGQYTYLYNGRTYFASEMATPDRKYWSDILAVFEDRFEEDNIRMVDYIYGNSVLSEDEKYEFIENCILKDSEK